MKNFTKIIENYNSIKPRSKWSQAVKDYAEDLIYFIELNELTKTEITEKTLLNGAKDWQEYSCGGCSLIYNEDIAQRICTPSEYKRFKNNGLKLLEAQGCALYQAAKALLQ